MGTGLVIVCGIKGYPFVAVMSRGNSEERASMMQTLGAGVVLVDQLPDSKVGEVSGLDLAQVEQVAQQITVDRSAFRADQFNHCGNPNAHYQTTGPEFWAQSQGNLDAFCDFVGSGGTLAGVSTYLREQNPTIKCYAIEPKGAAVLAGQTATNPQHPIQGGGYVMDNLSFLHNIQWDGFLQIDGETARQTTQDLAQYEGIFAGFSSGANVAGALHLLKTSHQGQTIGIVICDSGLKYLSTDLWQ